MHTCDLAGYRYVMGWQAKQQALQSPQGLTLHSVWYDIFDLVESRPFLLQPLWGGYRDDSEVKYLVEMLKLFTAVGNDKTCHCQGDLEMVRLDTS